MIGSLQTGVSGLQQFQQQLEVIGDNIANVSTTGYKASRMGFEDVFSQSFTQGNSTLQVGTGVGTSQIVQQYTQGSIESTGVATNLAIKGDGFFVVRDVSTGAQYVTRAGDFSKDANGYLVMPGGQRVQGYTGAAPYSSSSPIGDIQINGAVAAAALNDTTTPTPALKTFSIDASGQINALLDDGQSGVIGQVVLQNFSNPEALLKQGNNLLTYTANAGPLAAPVAPNTGGLGSIQSGAHETSNVDLASEMASLITAQRAFEANAKTITTSDEVLQTLVNLKR